MDSTTINILFAAGGIAVGVSIPLLVYFLQKRQAWKIAIKTHSLDEPAPYVSILGFNLIPDETYNIFYGVDFNSHNDKKILYDFPFIVGNSGAKSLKKLFLNIPFPPLLNILVPDQFIKLVHPFPDDNIKRTYIETKERKSVSFFIEQINPHTSIEFKEPLLLKETILKLEFPVDTMVNESGFLTLNSVYCYDVKMELSSENLKLLSYYFKIHIFNAKDMDHLCEITSKDYLKKIENSLNRNSKLSLIDTSLKNGYFLFYPTFETFVDPNNNNSVYLAKVDNSSFKYLISNIYEPFSQSNET